MLGFVNSVQILAIDDEDEPLRPSIIMSPQWSNLVLSTNIPDIEFDILVCHRLDIETDFERANVSFKL